MKLKDILAISGKGGLFKFISQARNGIIVESYTDGKRLAVHSSAKVSALEDIAIFTDTEEISLGDVFTKIFEKEEGKQTISHKASPDELKALLESIIPDYDRSRVYVSDMKKLVLWYNLLIDLDLLKPDEKDEKEEASEKTDTVKKSANVAEKKKQAPKSTINKPSSSAKVKSTASRSTKSK